jgi:outer membrane receptor for ferrienterochelin and colicins
LRASAGRGFRAATVAERYANIRYGPLQVIPNLTIRPEYSWSIETGINHVWSDGPVPLEVDLAVFDNELYDMIEPIIVPTGEIKFLNVTRARVLGSELTLRAMLTRGLGVETGLTMMLPRDLTLGQTLKYRNNVLWYSRASWDVVDALTVQAEYRFMNRVERVDELNVVTDYDARVPIHLVDARFIWHVDRLSDGAMPLTVSLIGKNVLDYYYTEVMGNLGPMRSVVLQLEYRQ